MAKKGKKTTIVLLLIFLLLFGLLAWLFVFGGADILSTSLSVDTRDDDRNGNGNGDGNGGNGADLNCRDFCDQRHYDFGYSDGGGSCDDHDHEHIADCCCYNVAAEEDDDDNGDNGNGAYPTEEECDIFCVGEGYDEGAELIFDDAEATNGCFEAEGEVRVDDCCCWNYVNGGPGGGYSSCVDACNDRGYHIGVPLPYGEVACDKIFDAEITEIVAGVSETCCCAYYTSFPNAEYSSTPYDEFCFDSDGGQVPGTGGFCLASSNDVPIYDMCFVDEQLREAYCNENLHCAMYSLYCSAGDGVCMNAVLGDFCGYF